MELKTVNKRITPTDSKDSVVEQEYPLSTPPTMPQSQSIEADVEVLTSERVSDLFNRLPGVAFKCHEGYFRIHKIDKKTGTFTAKLINPVRQSGSNSIPSKKKRKKK
jgi:hypothetical protein